MKRYTVVLDKRASKELKRLSAKQAKRVFEAIAGLADNPRPSGCLKLQGEDDIWRIRKGKYRVLYTINDDKIVVTVISVRHRKDVYR